MDWKVRYIDYPTQYGKIRDEVLQLLDATLGAMAERVKLLRDHGRKPDGELDGWAFNCRMDNVAAAILDLKLKLVPEWISRRRELAAAYDELLSDVPELLLPPAPETGGAYFDVFQNYEIEAERRDQLREHLIENRIEVMLPWGGKGVHQFEALGLESAPLPRTEKMFERAIMLPLHCELDDEHIAFVVATIRDFYDR